MSQMSVTTGIPRLVAHTSVPPPTFWAPFWRFSRMKSSFLVSQKVGGGGGHGLCATNLGREVHSNVKRATFRHEILDLGGAEAERT